MKMPSRWRRRLLRSARLRGLLCRAIAGYIRFVYFTNRWSTEGADVPHRLRAEGCGFIGAFWHGRMLMIPMAWRRLAPMHILISQHRDGRIIADAVGRFGVGSIAGSTQRGGAAALRALLKCLDAGDCVGITPDGPRGPAMVASAGIVNLARLSGAPIVPVTFATSRRRLMMSWDRFHLALPFGRGVFLIGEPIAVARDLDATEFEGVRRLVEARLNGLTIEADRRVGRVTPILPGRGLSIGTIQPDLVQETDREAVNSPAAPGRERVS
jgi:lysophospholipid acyltransferase (LPLAT)-like uncharacterized protein